jgi:hypothetical protein
VSTKWMKTALEKIEEILAVKKESAFGANI